MNQEFLPGGPPPHVEDMGTNMKDTHNSIFFAAVSTTRMPMIVTDPRQYDNPIIYANPAFMQMTGYEEKDLVGHNCRLLQGPETDPDVIQQVREAIFHRHEISVEVLNYKKDGSSFWNALFISPVFDLDDNLIYYFASQLDVSRRRDAEDALRQSQKMEAVGKLTGGIAHDFNNLLTVIQGFAETLQVNLNGEVINKEKALRHLNAIIQATEKGSSLTSQLLAFARKQKLQDRVVNIPHLIDQMLPLISRSVGDHIEVHVDHRGSLCNTRIDPVQAEMAILNIAVNAKDGMVGRGNLSICTKCITVTSSSTEFGHMNPGKYVQLSIEDDGEGIDSDILDKITEPFFTTKEEGKGTGLGLSMVYGFMKQSNGVLKIDSVKGEGTVVHMLFKAEDGLVEKPDIKAHRFLVGRQGDKETILVVEDKIQVAEYVQEVLMEFGYTVVRTSNADEAWSVFSLDPSIDLLFSDITMPGSMNGVALARKCRELKPSLKVLLTTGFNDTSVSIADENGKDFDVVEKPHRRSVLIEKIRLVIDGPNGIS